MSVYSVCCVCHSPDVAGVEKNRLEEKQRAARKDRKKKKDEWPTRSVNFVNGLLYQATLYQATC